MKKSVALLTFVLFVGCAVPALAQVANPNAELDAWGKAMVEWNRQNEELRQQFAADRELWLAQVKEANRPLSMKQKVLIGLAYVGDKVVTGYVNYHASRAAIRSEMPRFDGRFNAVRADVDRTSQQVLATGASLGLQLANAQGSLSRQLTDVAAAQSAGNANLSKQISDGQAAGAASLADGVQRILNGQSVIRNDISRGNLPLCTAANPFGKPTVNPPPCQE